MMIPTDWPLLKDAAGEDIVQYNLFAHAGKSERSKLESFQHSTFPICNSPVQGYINLLSYLDAEATFIVLDFIICIAIAARRMNLWSIQITLNRHFEG